MVRRRCAKGVRTDERRHRRESPALGDRGWLLLAYLEVASAMPWPIYEAAGFVWGAGLVVVAIGYALKSREELPPGGLAADRRPRLGIDPSSSRWTDTEPASIEADS